MAASPSTGVDTITGKGVADALAGRDVVIDATANRDDAMEFFTRSTRTLLEHERRAGTRHHVVLSVVGADRMPGSEYMRAKVAQEDLVARSGIPWSIVRATQFHDFIPTLATVFDTGDGIRVPQARIQPVSVDDAAGILAEIAVGNPLNGTIEVAGPEAMTFRDAIARVTKRPVVADVAVTYFGAALSDDTLLPQHAARLGTTRLPETAF
jgi:uncharacterized protein YbjT (DUF2867 family)